VPYSTQVVVAVVALVVVVLVVVFAGAEITAKGV